MKSFRYLLLIAATMILASCSKEAVLTYKVKNLATDSIRVVCLMRDHDIADTFWVGYNQWMTIGRANQGSGHISTYKQTGTVLTDIQWITIQKSSSGASTVTNFTRTSLWTYQENSAHMADYTTTVTDNNF